MTSVLTFSTADSSLTHLLLQSLRGLKYVSIHVPVPVQVVSSAKVAVNTAKDVVTGTVSETLTSVVGVVQDRVEKTKAVVSGSVSTVLESRVGQLVSSGVDTALTTSESLVEQYLPLTEHELGE